MELKDIEVGMRVLYTPEVVVVEGGEPATVSRVSDKYVFIKTDAEVKHMEGREFVPKAAKPEHINLLEEGGE